MPSTLTCPYLVAATQHLKTQCQCLVVFYTLPPSILSFLMMTGPVAVLRGDKRHPSSFQARGRHPSVREALRRGSETPLARRHRGECRDRARRGQRWGSSRDISDTRYTYLSDVERCANQSIASFVGPLSVFKFYFIYKTRNKVLHGLT